MLFISLVGYELWAKAWRQCTLWSAGCRDSVVLRGGLAWNCGAWCGGRFASPAHS